MKQSVCCSLYIAFDIMIGIWLSSDKCIYILKALFCDKLNVVQPWKVLIIVINSVAMIKLSKNNSSLGVT